MADPRDLVLIQQVLDWLNSNSQAFNNISTQVNIPLAITDCSVDWLSYTGRRSLNKFIPCNDVYDGMGGDRQFLRDFPVGLVSAVYANATPVPAGSVGMDGAITPGWVLDSKRESISMVGAAPGLGYGIGRGTGSGGAYAVTGTYQRTRVGLAFGGRNDNGRQNVQVQYFGGGSVMFSEVQEIEGGAITVSQAANFWSDLNQVYYATPQNGQLVQFEYVESDPAQGQFTFNSDGVYNFNAADDGQLVAITYGYNLAMPDVQDACLMQIAETLFTRKTVGLKSVAGDGGETTVYSKVARPERVLEVMRKYKRAMIGV